LQKLYKDKAQSPFSVEVYIELAKISENIWKLNEEYFEEQKSKVKALENENTRIGKK